MPGRITAAPGLSMARNFWRVVSGIRRWCRNGSKTSSDLASRDQHDGAGGPARFDIAVGLGGLAERIALADLDLDLAAADHGEQVVRGFQEFGPGWYVFDQARVGDEQRSHVAKLARGCWRWVARRFSERGEDAARRQTLERILE